MIDALLYLVGILIVLVGIALSIGLHEIGHLFPAKLFGVRVTQYMIGFGPTVRSWTKNGTEYGFKAIPLGGYILMSGMYPPESKKQYRGPFANWIKDARKQVREGLDPADENRQFYKLTAPKKLTIMLGGPVMNLLLGSILIMLALSGIGTLQPTMGVNQVYLCIESTADGVCPAGSPESPASIAGLQTGDVIQEVNGISVSSWQQAIEELSKNPQSASTLRVLRNETVIQIPIVPTFVEVQIRDEAGNPVVDEAGLPVTQLRPILGIQLQSELVPMSVGESFGFAASATGAMASFVVDLPNQVYQVAASTFGFGQRDPNGAVSILGVGQLAGELTAAEISIEAKLASLLLLIGSLNLALFVFNLIPLLPLDGGHVAGAVYESGKRRIVRLVSKKDPGPIDTARALPIAYAVWVLLIATGAILIVADLVNPIRLG